MRKPFRQVLSANAILQQLNFPVGNPGDLDMECEYLHCNIRLPNLRRQHLSYRTSETRAAEAAQLAPEFFPDPFRGSTEQVQRVPPAVNTDRAHRVGTPV